MGHSAHPANTSIYLSDGLCVFHGSHLGSYAVDHDAVADGAPGYRNLGPFLSFDQMLEQILSSLMNSLSHKLQILSGSRKSKFKAPACLPMPTSMLISVRNPVVPVFVPPPTSIVPLTSALPPLLLQTAIPIVVLVAAVSPPPLLMLLILLPPAPLGMTFVIVVVSPSRLLALFVVRVVAPPRRVVRALIQEG